MFRSGSPPSRRSCSPPRPPPPAPSATASSAPKQTLRMHYAAAKAVLHGQLKNPRFDPRTDDGFTDLHVTAVLKDDPARGGRAVLDAAAVPAGGRQHAAAITWSSATCANGKLDPTFGLPPRGRVVDYLQGRRDLDDTRPGGEARLLLQAPRLARTRTIAADAFLEFATATDADILKAAKQLDAAKVRKLIADPNTPPERLGVFAFLLGVCGDAGRRRRSWPRSLTQNPLAERTATAFGGLLAGLHPAAARRTGWSVRRRGPGRREAAATGQAAVRDRHGAVLPGHPRGRVQAEC